MSNLEALNPSPQQPLNDEAGQRLRDGQSVFAEVRRLIAQGVTPAAATEMLRSAHAALVAERATAAEQATQLHRTIAHHIVDGRSDAEIERVVTARGVDAAAARTLIAGARAAWQRRPRSGMFVQPRIFVQPLARQIAIGCVLLLSLVVLTPGRNKVWSSSAVEQQQLAALVSLPSMSASVTIVPNAVVVAQQLNVRTGPNPDDPVMLQLMRDMELEVIAKARDLQRLKVKLPDNREGWVRNDPNLLHLDTSLDTIPIAQ